MKTSTKRKAISKKEVKIHKGVVLKPIVKQIKSSQVKTSGTRPPRPLAQTLEINPFRDLETCELVNFNQAMDDNKGYRGWDETDSQNTVEQIKNAGKWLGLEEPTPNYWKYACFAILLGIVVAMILSTPLFVKLAEVCSQ